MDFTQIFFCCVCLLEWKLNGKVTQKNTPKMKEKKRHSAKNVSLFFISFVLVRYDGWCFSNTSSYVGINKLKLFWFDFSNYYFWQLISISYLYMDYLFMCFFLHILFFFALHLPTGSSKFQRDLLKPSNQIQLCKKSNSYLFKFYYVCLETIRRAYVLVANKTI